MSRAKKQKSRRRQDNFVQEAPKPLKWQFLRRLNKLLLSRGLETRESE